MKNEPCKNCGNFDYYIKGDFSYCRPCHSEAQKRYATRKRVGDEPAILRSPAIALADMSLGSTLALTCRQGHQLTGSNARMSSQRNGKHLRRRCRTCERNAKRVLYGLAPEPSPTRLTDLLDS